METEENSHWTKERWEQEKENVSKCLEETKLFVITNNSISEENIEIKTLEDFSRATKLKETLDKLETKKNYIVFLENRLEKINKIIGG